MAFGRTLPPWFGRQVAPPVDPSMMGMLPQVGPQTPQFTAGQQIAPAAAPLMEQTGPSRADVARAQDIASGVDMGYGLENVRDPWSALAYAVNKGVTGYAQGKAKRMGEAQKAADRKALADALNSADPMTALSQLDIPEVQDMMVQSKIGQLTKAPAEKWNDVDTDQDGQPDAQRNSITGEYKPIEQKLTFEQKRVLARDGRSVSNTTVNTGGGSDKQIYDTLGESAKMAQSAAVGLNGLREAEAALKGPGIYGAYANERLLLAKVASAFGADPSAVVNTETFRSAIAPQVSALVKATVGTANISNADREFAEKAAGGSIDLDKRTLLRLVDIGRRASQGAIKAHNDKLNKVYPDQNRFQREHALFGVQVDAGPKQIGTQQEYNALKPGEEYIAPDGSTRRKQ